ncbi:MAG: NAD(P)H-hydrate dehydratase [Thermodesulfobacteriota bacterium]
MKFCFTAEMRRLDEKTILECGIPGVVLMENAGRGAAEFCRRRYGDLKGRRVAIVAGRGNNGGDGFVMARVFHGWGARARVFLLGEREQVKGDARINLEAALKMGLEVIEIQAEAQLERLDLTGCDLIVDAVFGIGLSSEPKGIHRGAIEAMNRSGTPVVAVDVPSGLDADTGRSLGLCVRADMTVTFGLPKAGLLLPPGEELAGRLEIVDIGIPPHVLAEADPGKELILEDNLRGLLRPRARDSHKGTYGHALIVAGSTGKTGAAAMAALTAARTGAGLVTLAVPAGLNPILEVKITEAMTEPLPEDEPGFLAAAAADRVLELAQDKSVLALGPGLGTKPGAVALVRRLVTEAGPPLVIDADGLNALAGAADLLRQARRETVLTPHPGEMARLAGCSTTDIQNDRLGRASKFAQAYGVILVLKGYRTVVAGPDGRIFLNATGGPHLASGGMGDVLTGLIAGLVSQGLSPLEAARLGVFVHGLAGDRAAAERGPIGLLASDLIDYLPGLWAGLIKPETPR